MAEWNGSLIEAMSKLPEGSVGVLIIDEQDGFDSPDDRRQQLLARQQTLIMAASRLGCRFWLVELDPSGNGNASATILRLRALVGADRSSRIVKTKFNGFDGTTLDNELRQAHVTHVVVLGHQTNCCVMQTAIGGFYERRRGTFVQGATGRGFKVLSSDQVLSGDEAIWKLEDRVTFFSKL